MAAKQKPRRSFSLAEKKNFVLLINQDVAGGMEVQASCKKHKIGVTQYNNWKKGKAMTEKYAASHGSETVIDVSTLPPRPKKHGGARNMTGKRGKIIPPKKRARLVAKIEALITKKKMNASDAARKVGINPSSYYLWKRQPEMIEQKTLPVPVHMPITNGHAKANGNGHAIGPVQIALQVTGISLSSVTGQPVSISLQEAIRLQQGIDKLLHP